MLVEIPDPEVILGGITAFLIGVFGLFFYYKLKPYVNLKQKGSDPAYLERLEYYEQQLIDMKIRLDVLDMAGPESKYSPIEKEPREQARLHVPDAPGRQVREKIETTDTQKQEIAPSFSHADITNHVLHLITDKSMTSRDIQITVGRTREHTSRLMKKMFEDGLVERHTDSKPYAYSITDKGREKIGLARSIPATM